MKHPTRKGVIMAMLPSAVGPVLFDTSFCSCQPAR